MSFEDFLTQQKNPQTADALAPPATPGLGVAPDQFEAFLRKAQGASNDATVQSAQAATVANSSQSADVAAQAAPVSRKLGVPQAAIETDLPRFQQQVKMQDNAALLAQNPVLAKWVAANPDSARIAQDEYDKMSAAEKLWQGTEDAAYAGAQALGKTWADLALASSRTVGAVPGLIDLFNTGKAEGPAWDWWKRNFIEPDKARVAALSLRQGAGFGEKSAAAVGGLLSVLSQATLTGGVSEAPMAAGTLQALGQTGLTAAKAMAFPSLSAAVNTSADVYEKTGDQVAAHKAGVAAYLFGVLQGAIPFSAPGNLASRAVTGFGSSVVSGEFQREAMNLLLPPEMQTKFDPQEMLFQGVQGAMLAGVLGPRKEPDLYRGVRQTYTDAARAESAERDVGKVAQLGQLAAESKLREADPEAYKRFVETVTDKSDLDAVYVNGRELNNAFAQSGFDAATLPDLASKTAEAVATGGDVRIPVADYAAHIAGTDLEKAILPSMKASPDGMTYKEGQDYYAKAAETMKSSAEEVVARRQQRADLDNDRASVNQTLYDQMVKAGREPSIAKTEAMLTTEFYTTMATREGMKPSEFMAQHPLNFASEAGGGFGQGEVASPTTAAPARGMYNPMTKTISILKDADLSTAVHELGHHFLDTLSHVSTAEKASESTKSDFGTLLNWFGVKDSETWHKLSIDEQRPYHEKLAKAFEQYMFEGRAPKLELQSVFGRIRAWMLNVYRNAANIGAELSPEIRGVFDRMLASDEAIKEAEQTRGYQPLFDNAKAAGMTAEEFNAYLDQGKAATESAVNSMQAKSLKDMQWLSNAKSKALRSLQRQADAARKEVRAQVENEVSQQPIYQLQDYLKSHKNYDPEIVANMHGYEDAHHMQQALDQAGSKKDTIDAITDQRMLQQHGELADPQSVETAANEAVHNEARARFMATGLKALTDSPLPANQIAKAAKEAAEAAIAGKTVGELRPDQYLAAEARSNREALAAAAKDPAAAIEAQRAAILNNRLAKAAMDAQAEVQKGLDYLKKFDKPTVAKAVGGEYMDRINELLAQYDVTNRFNTKSDVQARQNMRDWLKSESDRTGVMPEVSDNLLDFTQRRHWKELTVEDFRGLVDAAKSLEHVGREQMLITVAGQKVALQEKVDQAKADMAALPHSEPIDVQPHLKHAEGLDKISARFLSAKSKIRGIDAALVKMEQLFQWLTYGTKAGLGETRGGPFLEMFQRAGDAEGSERQMRAESANDMRALGESLRDAKVNLNEKLDLPLKRPGRGGQWYREELIAAALNTGNEGNLRKLIEGYRETDPAWSRAGLMAALDQHLSAPEWKFVQGVWDAIGKYGPQVAELQKRQTGVAPKLIEAQTVKTQHGEFKGGYYPVVYDAFLDHNIETKNAKNADALFENPFGRPSTSKGHTIERTDYTGPIQLSLGVISRHLDQVTHDLAWREAIVDINKFLSHPEIRSEVDQTMGREYTKQFRPWLQAMANDKVFNTAGDSAWESFYRKVRSNATMVGLGFRLSTMLIHGTSAMSNSIGEVGTKWFAKGAAEFARDWEGTKAFMYERSPEMANRFNESDRNIHEAIDQINEHQKSLGAISATQKAVDGARKFAFYGVSALDMGSAAPTWMAAYMKGMEHEAKGGLGMSEDAAIDYANRAVRNAHGGGGAKDLSAVQRDKGAMSLATMFYSFWNHMYNRQRDLAKGYGNLPESFKQGTGTRDFAKLLARSWWYFVIPQVIHALLKPTPANEQEGGEDDLGAMAAHMGKEIGLGFVSGVPVLRDLANAAINGRDYTITPLEQAGKSVVKAAVDTTHWVKGEEMSPHAGKNFAQAAGYTLGLPTGQLSGTGSFLWDVYNGDADPQGLKDWYTGIQNGRISP